jgi:alkylation response protein AidB-like acyl-CoA dehydrogenase
MKAIISNQLQIRFKNFAENEISGHDEFHKMTQFPDELWREMKDRRLFGVGIDEKFGGHGGDARDVALAGWTLTANGGNMGIAMTWMMHELISRCLIAEFGSRHQQNELLPRLSRGDITISLAASEPNTGAHPKYMRTTAVSIESGYRINGEKSYLTNGPLADLFIIITLTSEHSGNKEFSAFLVPKSASGLSITDTMDLPILKPSPHCGIILSDCIVGKDRLFGIPGKAYETIVKPFREIEDAMLMGPISGGLHFQLACLNRIMHQRGIRLDDEMILELGAMQCTAEALLALALTAAERIDSKNAFPTAGPLTLYFRNQVSDFQDRIGRIITTIDGETDFFLSSMSKDIAGGIRIASNVAKLKLKRIGESFMTPGRST